MAISGSKTRSDSGPATKYVTSGVAWVIARRRTFSWTRFLTRLEDVLPPEVRVVSISLTRGDKEAADLASALEQAGRASGVHTDLSDADVFDVVIGQGYVPHIKHRRLKNEAPDPCPVPGELRYPARRWVVEHTLGWLVKRRSLRIRWCKKSSNWLAFVQLACASILCDMAVFG